MNNNKKIKDVNYYSDLLYKDSIVLLVISALYFIFMIAVFHSPNGLLFIILEAIIIAKRKNEKLYGTLALVSAILMVGESLISSSAISYLYIILGIIYIIHSAIYLNKLKK